MAKFTKLERMAQGKQTRSRALVRMAIREQKKAADISRRTARAQAPLLRSVCLAGEIEMMARSVRGIEVTA